MIIDELLKYNIEPMTAIVIMIYPFIYVNYMMVGPGEKRLDAM